MRNILVITIIDYERSIHQRTHRLVDFLKNEGPITVLHLRNLPRTNSFLRKLRYLLSASSETSASDNIELISVVTIHTPFNKKGSISDFAMVVFLVRELLRRSTKAFDVCIAQAPWSGVAGFVLKKFGRVRYLVYEDLDLFPEFTSHRFQKRVIHYLEGAAIRKSDLLICVGKELASLRKRQYGKKAVVIPNGVDFQLFSEVSERSARPFTLAYIGSLEEWAGVELPIRAMPKLLQEIPDIRYLIVGKGSDEYEQRLRELVKENELEAHVFFEGHQKYSDLPRFLAEADVGIATFKPQKLMHYAFTLKVIEYMAAGLPVIGTNIGETNRILQQTSAGIAIPFSEDAFVGAVLGLYGRNNWSELSKSAQEFASNFDWNALFGREWAEIKRGIERQES